MSIRTWIPFITVVLLAVPTAAEDPSTEAMSLAGRIDAVEQRLEQTAFTLDRVLKKVDDLLWFERIGDVADLDKVYIYFNNDVEGYAIKNAVTIREYLEKGRQN